MYLKVEDIRKEFKRLYTSGIFNARGMLDIQGSSFIADEQSIFGEPNQEYIEKELAWYLLQSRNVYDMPNPPKIWRDIATADGYVNSNYGYLVFGKDNNNQFQKVVRTLRRRIDSKQATMIYTRPSMHQDSFADGRKDFVCTNTVNYNQDLLDPKKLNCIVNMRSNDAVYGYKNDLPWQQYVLQRVCDEVDMIPGIIYWQTSSLHIYPRHFHLL